MVIICYSAFTLSLFESREAINNKSIAVEQKSSVVAPLIPPVFEFSQVSVTSYKQGVNRESTLDHESKIRQMVDDNSPRRKLKGKLHETKKLLSMHGREA